MDNGNEKRFPLATVIVSVTLVVLALVGLKMCHKTAEVATQGIDRGLDTVDQAVNQGLGILPKFMTGQITETFRSSIPTVKSTGGDILEVAVSQSEEFFSRSDERRFAWDWVSLGTTVAEVRVPVTFRYHVRLSDQWRLANRDQVCLVLAPKLRPSLPPAIHTGAMEQRAESGWARFDKQEHLENLLADLTRLLSQRARDPQHLALVRESARQSVGAFVQKWLLREDQWGPGKFRAVVVMFPDEVNVNSDADLAKLHLTPTLKLETQQ